MKNTPVPPGVTHFLMKKPGGETETDSKAHALIQDGMIRRRTKPFTDCGGPFKHLNGKCSLEIVLKNGIDFPKIIGIKPPKSKNKKPAESPEKTPETER